MADANTFALAYGARTATETRSELGVRGDKSMAMQDGVFTLRGRLAWAHDYNADRNVGATFQTLPGASCRERRAAAERLCACDCRGRMEVAERLVGCGHLRG